MQECVVISWYYVKVRAKDIKFICRLGMSASETLLATVYNDDSLKKRAFTTDFQDFRVKIKAVVKYLQPSEMKECLDK